MPAKKTARPKKDPEREARIEEEVLVDCYNEAERVSGWFCYLENQLTCPFTAECVNQSEVSPLKLGEHVRVLKILDTEAASNGAFFGQVEWQGRKLGVPLADLKAIKAD